MSEHESHNQRLCTSCNEWIDARATTCYLCGEDKAEYNHALKKANDMARLNGALSSQLGTVRGEMAAEQRIRGARNTVTGHVGALPTAGYQSLQGKIKQALQNQNFAE